MVRELAIFMKIQGVVSLSGGEIGGLGSIRFARIKANFIRLAQFPAVQHKKSPLGFPWEAFHTCHMFSAYDF